MEIAKSGNGIKGWSFRTKINATLITVFSLLLIASAVSKYNSQSSQLEQLLETNTAANTEVFQAQISSDAEGLARALAGMTRIEALLEPFAAGDRDKLLEVVKPIFADLKAKNNITHTYFIDTNGVVFLRAHNPKQFGDEVKRNSFKLARDRNGLGVSLDMGKNFFSLRAVIPVQYKGKHIGYMEAAQEIDHLFGRTQKITGFEPTVLISKEYQDRLGTQIKGASVADYNLLDSTDSQTAVKLVDAMHMTSGGNQAFTGFVGNYFVGASPLKDGSGQTAGILMFHKNVADMRTAMWGQITNSILIQSVLIIAGLIVVALVIRSTLRVLGGDPEYAREITKIIANGDLQQEIATEKGDNNSLLAAMKQMRDQLRGAVSGIHEVSLRIAEASHQIAEGNTSLSQRTEEQASSLEETASSMEEMTGTVKQNADSAAEAKRLADANSVRAGNGAEVITRTIGAMAEINDSSSKISDIITTIDGIAFQTNLLALNAAVEAARAGEQGRGFAVVASEVRSLAQRSAEAAKEIKALIEDSVSKVKIGTELVDESGKTLEGIIDGTNKVADIIAEIAAASNEQASGIDQVNNAIAQMDNTTQENAALVEEAAASSRSMQDQAEQLRELMSYFRIDGSSRIGNTGQDYRLEANQARPVASRQSLESTRITRTRPIAVESSEWEQF